MQNDCVAFAFWKQKRAESRHMVTEKECVAVLL
jgi:hypothetical protein